MLGDEVRALKCGEVSASVQCRMKLWDPERLT
jgi:hypothetical protein